MWPALALHIIVGISGSIIVFVCFRHQKKPVFVKVIWGLIMIDIAINIAYDILYHINLSSALHIKDNYKAMNSLIGQVVHWLFAVEYFKVVLNLPLLMERDEN